MYLQFYFFSFIIVNIFFYIIVAIFSAYSVNFISCLKGIYQHDSLPA